MTRFIFLAKNLAIWTLRRSFADMAEDKLILFLQQNKDHFKYSSIDAAIGMPQGTTSRVVRGVDYRHFTDEQRAAVHTYLQLHVERIKKYMAKNLAMSE